MSVYDPEMLIFLDKTGADWRNSIRRYGYMILENHQLLLQGHWISELAFISMCGLLDVKVVEGTSNGDTVIPL